MLIHEINEHLDNAINLADEILEGTSALSQLDSGQWLMLIEARQRLVQVRNELGEEETGFSPDFTGAAVTLTSVDDEPYGSGDDDGTGFGEGNNPNHFDE